MSHAYSPLAHYYRVPLLVLAAALRKVPVVVQDEIVIRPMPAAEFAFPGPLRDQLVAAIIAGGKTTTTGLVADYQHEDPSPGCGRRWATRPATGWP